MREIHGMKNTPEHNTWVRIRQRCNNPSNADYPSYGGRGIKVCERWDNSFKAFYEDMGDRPTKHSINRIDNNGHYEPSNCEWATDKAQARNKRNSVYHTIDGVTKTFAEWCEMNSLRPTTVRSRMNREGVCLKDALRQPVRDNVFTKGHRYFAGRWK